MQKIELDISWEIEEDREIEDRIKEVVRYALEVENAKCDVNLSVVVTDNENIREINKEQRNIDNPTDQYDNYYLHSSSLIILVKNHCNTTVF